MAEVVLSGRSGSLPGRVIEIFTAAAVVLAWLVFRYDHHRRERDALDASYGLLGAVYDGMVKGVPAKGAPPAGWGHLYFVTEYDDQSATTRAHRTRDGVLQRRSFDQVFVVPTEPLAKLATSAPQEGLINPLTVAVANHALWRVHTFNQLVGQLTDFNTQHAAEVLSDATDERRRTDLADAAASLSKFLHKDGIGLSWSQQPDGSWGWYGALVMALQANITELETKRGTPRWRQFLDWPYSVGDLLVMAGLIIVVVTVVR